MATKQVSECVAQIRFQQIRTIPVNWIFRVRYHGHNIASKFLIPLSGTLAGVERGRDTSTYLMTPHHALGQNQ